MFFTAIALTLGYTFNKHSINNDGIAAFAMFGAMEFAFELIILVDKL